ncbi:hypothetical protein L202_06300 [Cryptococcus amylolentus CBS 6039]|uniref:Uncharacterized protein n=1 Tax=Cryptococcus amylolentus CBS 6039 TaxID=1295533 RepID=A0A1E3HFJ0_9TREE|nr:hypothetical protein L202_06300 [Cryptococcus amylolentus CBS 6039]ODN75084.1 hypothetical protein L202_06300 [Cryptococcus amylolentus CBS 6039]
MWGLRAACSGREIDPNALTRENMEHTSALWSLRSVLAPGTPGKWNQTVVHALGRKYFVDETLNNQGRYMEP